MLERFLHRTRKGQRQQVPGRATPLIITVPNAIAVTTQVIERRRVP